MGKNVLFLCLSLVTKGSKLNQYFYDGEEKRFDGFMTNEGPAKKVIQSLNKKGERLDKIVFVCSQKTREEEIKNEAIKERFVSMNGQVKDKITTVDYYQKMIESFSTEINKEYRENPIMFCPISISDDPDEQEIADVVVKAARKIQDSSERDVKLYIDYNGGPRYIAFMIVAISNLMKLREVDIREILVMNFENKREDAICIQNMKETFRCIDLVSGISEYINYGRIKILKKYFKSCKNERIEEILDTMETFSKELQLCRTNRVLESRDQLKVKLNAYMEYNQEEENTVEILFRYVVEDILKGYQGILEGEIPDIIEWCVNKDFVQQALTFYTEKMPGYFWDTGILHPTKQEEVEYNEFLNDGEKKDVISVPGLDENARKKVLKTYNFYREYDKKYSWMVKYLFQQSDEKKELPKEYTEGKIRGKSEKPCNVSITDANLTKEEKQEIKKTVGIWIAHLKTGRVRTCIKKQKLKEVLMDYQLLKRQRNCTNHASDGKKGNAGEWDYDKLCQRMLLAVDRIKVVLKKE